MATPLGKWDDVLDSLVANGVAVFNFHELTFCCDRDGVQCNFSINDGLTFTVTSVWPDLPLSSEEGRHQVVRLLESISCRCRHFMAAEIRFVNYCRKYGMKTL